MFPPLHVKLGFNTLLTRFYDFVDSLDGVETLPEEVQQARGQYMSCLIELDDRKDTLVLWEALNSTVLGHYHAKKIRLTRRIARMSGPGNEQNRERKVLLRDLCSRDIKRLISRKVMLVLYISV